MVWGAVSLTKKAARLVGFVLVVGLCSLLVVACGSQGGGQGSEQGGEQGTTSLKLVSFLPSNHPLTKEVVPMWIERVEKETDGAVKIEWVGPEAIPPPDQFNAVRDGVADIGFTVGTYYENQVPTVPAMQLSPYKPAEERESDYFDYLVERHEKAGVTYLGRWLATSPFYFWSNEKIEALEGFEGVTFRSNPTYDPILQALGAEPVNVVAGDVYTSLERGVVEGFGFPVLGPRQSGWTEVTKFIIDEPYLVQNGTILVNPATFDSLPSDVREAMRKATADFEPEMQAYFEKEAGKEWETLRESGGVEPVEFSPDDSEQFLNLWVEEYWKTLEKEVPNEVEQLKELLPPEELKKRFATMKNQ